VCQKRIGPVSHPATQTSVESGIYVEYHSVSSIRDGAPIKFDVTASGDDYIDLADSFLYARAKIIRANGDKLDAADTAEPVKNFLHSLFSQVDISLNGTLIASSMNTQHISKPYSVSESKRTPRS
jgi:hypothetical protein